MKKICLLISLFISITLFAEKIPAIDYTKLSFGEDNTLEVMTWNIEHFPKSEITVSYVANVIHSVDPDVIGLQEIESDSAFVLLVKKLQTIAPENKWKGYRANTNEWEMNLAYLYKTAVVSVDTIYQIYPDDKIYHQPFPRKPLVLEFTYDNENYFVINNHFKAYGGPDNESRRRKATGLLDKYIEENLSDEEVFVIGDLNDWITDPDESNVFLEFINDPQNYRFTDMQIAVDSTADWSYPYWKYRGHLDHILITNELFDEFENKNAKVKTVVIDKFMEGGDDARYKYITDHRPVVVKLWMETATN